MTESLQTIKELVELLNKAKDGSTALKLCDLILEDLDSLQLIFQSALEKRAEFKGFEEQLEGVVGSIEVSAQGCGYNQFAPADEGAATEENDNVESDGNGAATESDAQHNQTEEAAFVNTQTDEISDGVLIAEEIDSVVNLAEKKKKSTQESNITTKSTIPSNDSAAGDNEEQIDDEKWQKLEQENQKLIESLTNAAL